MTFLLSHIVYKKFFINFKNYIELLVRKKYLIRIIDYKLISNYKDFDINDHKFYDSKRAKNFELAKELFSNDSSNQERIFDNNTKFIIDYQTSISKLNKLLFDSKLPEVKTAIKNAFGQLSVHKIFQTGQRCFKHLLNLQKQILETPIDTIDTLYPQINENMLFHSFYIQVIKNLHSITDNDGINV